MTETTPAAVARRQRLHQIRVRVAAGAVSLFVAVFSVIYTQAPKSTTSTTAAQRQPVASASSSSAQSQSTSLTTSQS